MTNDEKIKEIVQHDEKNVKGFFYEYRFLSNMELGNVFYDEEMYKSSENAYQAAKFGDPEHKEQIRMGDPYKAKNLAKKLRNYVHENWDAVKEEVMREIVTDKFTRNPRLKYQLLATGDKYLEETNYWGDTFWGVCKGQGLNTLGRILMDVRTQLRNAS